MTSDLGNPAPDLDPYFVPGDQNWKDKAKSLRPGDADIRRDLLATEAAFRFAGTMGVLLGASIFVIYAIPVSAMLREGGDPGGILLVEDWLWRRWVARMTSVFVLAVMAVVTCWGLRRLQPWARLSLIGLGIVPPVSLVTGLVRRAWGADPAQWELSDVLIMTFVGMLVYPASFFTLWTACSRRGRAVFSRHYREIADRTPKQTPEFMAGFRTGVVLTCALLILYWTTMLLVLSALAAGGVIRSP